MAIAKIRGTLIQAASSRESPWIGTPTALASLRWYLKKKKDNGHSDGDRKEEAHGADKKHQGVHMRREVGRLLRIQWQLRLHGLVRSSFSRTAEWPTQVRGRYNFTAPENQDSADNA